MVRIRQIHTWLGVFFAPMLLGFIFTGAWQTFVSDDDRKVGAFNQAMSKISMIHTDDYYHNGTDDYHASLYFKYMVAAMSAALMLTILLGLALACQNRRMVAIYALSLVLGIVVPALFLYFN